MVRVAWNSGITKHKTKPCLCGCGEFVKVHKYSRKNGKGFVYLVCDFIRGHGKRDVCGFNPEIHSPRLCACGCGMATTKFRGRFNRFIKSHENIGRAPWNKGKQFSEASRIKMSLARLGREPANKAHIDLSKLYQLYVIDKKTISQVSKILNISKDAIKNRLRFLEWSRTTKESCALPEFKETMRKLRIKTLTSQKVIGTPNKLEKTVYNTLDEFGVKYQKQVSLFDKFVVDVLFPECRLVLEIFGRYWHENPKIRKKDYSKKRYLEKCGYSVEEIWDNEIKKEGVQPILQKVLRKYSLV